MACPECKMARRELGTVQHRMVELRAKMSRLADEMERWYRMGEPSMKTIVEELRNG